MKDSLVVNDGDKRFALDLSEVQISYQEENQRFKDTLSTNFSFPFEFHIDRNLRILMGDFSSMNVYDLKTYYKDCYLISDGKIREAELEILSSVGEVVRAQIDLGFEQFPNWDKKLRDLPLEVVQSSGSDMIPIAEQTIGQTYPAVNYNFPMIHSDLYDDSSAFEDFKGIINKRLEGSFVTNDADVSENEYHNYNLVIPIPYWLYILKVGFEDAGFTLHGDVLECEDLKSALVAPTMVELFENRESVEWIVMQQNGGSASQYYDEQPIHLIGQFRYRIDLTVIVTNWGSSTYPKITFNGEVLHQWSSSQHYTGSFILTTIPGEENILRFEGLVISPEQNLMVVEIIPLVLYDDDGNFLNPRADFNEMQLSEHLPDITFGEFVTITKNIGNFDYTVIGDREVYMNHIEKAFENTELTDISEYEVRYPERNYEESKSFLLKYTDVDSEEYDFPVIYYDVDGVQSEDYPDNDETKKIEIKAIPLPLKTTEGITTAHQFLDTDTIVQIIRYEGLQDEKNVCISNAPFDILNIYNKYWAKWLLFRVYASTLKWTFYVNKNKWRGIGIFDNLYAYFQKLWIRKINKTSINSRVYEIDIECDIVKN